MKVLYFLSGFFWAILMIFKYLFMGVALSLIIGVQAGAGCVNRSIFGWELDDLEIMDLVTEEQENDYYE